MFDFEKCFLNESQSHQHLGLAPGTCPGGGTFSRALSHLPLLGVICVLLALACFWGQVYPGHPCGHSSPDPGLLFPTQVSCFLSRTPACFRVSHAVAHWLCPDDLRGVCVQSISQWVYIYLHEHQEETCHLHPKSKNSRLLRHKTKLS